MGAADVVHEEQIPYDGILDDKESDKINSTLDKLEQKAISELEKQVV